MAKKKVFVVRYGRLLSCQRSVTLSSWMYLT